MSDLTQEQAQEALDFNVDEWLSDANLPEESAQIYKRADVISELTRLKGEIEIEREADLERSASEESPVKELRRKYEHLARVFGDSAMTVYVRALTPDEKELIRKENEEASEKGKWEKAKENRDFAARLLSKSIVGIKTPTDEERKPVFWSPATIIKMEDKLGTTQMNQVMYAYQTAQNAMPKVDADFLPSRSGSDPIQD